MFTMKSGLLLTAVLATAFSMAAAAPVAAAESGEYLAAQQLINSNSSSADNKTSV
jgi:hypothetical protein